MAEPAVNMNIVEDVVVCEERQAKEVVFLEEVMEDDASAFLVNGESSLTRYSRECFGGIREKSPLGRTPAYGMNRRISGGFRNIWTRWLKEEEEVSLRIEVPEEN